MLPATLSYETLLGIWWHRDLIRHRLMKPWLDMIARIAERASGGLG